MERPLDQLRIYALGNSINPEVQDVYLAAKELQKKLRINDLILPIDHLATRIYSQNREVAILEWLSLSSYYYLGLLQHQRPELLDKRHQERASQQ